MGLLRRAGALLLLQGVVSLADNVDPTSAALAADDECAAAEDAAQCALNAIQLRGLKKSTQEAAEDTGLGAFGLPRTHGRGDTKHKDSKAVPPSNVTQNTTGKDVQNTTAKAVVELTLKTRGPPKNAMAYKGLAWPDMKIGGAGPHHIFAIGDWGGLDGSLQPIEGRPRMIAYQGGHTPGPHIFPRNRWDKPHLTCICSRPALLDCFNSHGAKCDPGCGFEAGVDDRAQFLVADALRARAANNTPEMILNVGDNFYWGGIDKTCGTPMGTISPTARHQFNAVFEGIYNGPGLNNKPWISVLGNHDWGGRVFNNGWDQQIAYTWASNRWVMPAPYYSLHADFVDAGFSVDFYMIDSNFIDANDPEEDIEHNICGQHNPPDANCSVQGGPPSMKECKDWFANLWAEQQVWLEQRLAASTADWQVVVTHFPCGHEEAWYSKLRSQYGLDLLVTGHRHDQELWENSPRLGGLTCFVTGGGGGITSEASPLNTTHWYGEAQYGFYDLTFTKSAILIESVNYNGTIMKTAKVAPAR